MVAILREGEDAHSWFQRKPDDLRRCLCAPRVFPHAVSSVEAWKCKVGGGSVALLLVRAAEEVTAPARVFATPVAAASSTQACKAASVLAHEHILALVERCDKALSGVDDVS